MFKEWFEQQYQKGKISLLKSVLLNQAIENTNYVSIAPQGETLFGWGGWGGGIQIAHQKI